MILQAVPAWRVAAHFDLDHHFVAHDAIADIALGDTKPFTGGAIVAFDRRQAGLRPDTYAANANHSVAAAEHFLHAAETASAFAAVGGHDAREIAQIEADHRLLAPVQDRAHHVPDFAVGHRLVVFHADNLEESAVLVKMHAVFVLAFECAHAHLMCVPYMS